jgi:universal stress protein A
MTIYKHILLAVDFAQDSRPITLQAGEMAQKFSSKLSIVHVLDTIPMPDTSYGTVIGLNDEIDNALLNQEKANLNEMGELLNVPENQRWLIWGSPKEEICALAMQEEVDLIVVGSHGRHGLALLLGSTANDVLHHAPCDVLAVRLPNG